MRVSCLLLTALLSDFEILQYSESTKSGILNSFTKQTNVLDVDKHMMKYIEEEMKKRRGETGESEDNSKDQSDRHGDADILDELGIRVSFVGRGGSSPACFSWPVCNGSHR